MLEIKNNFYLIVTCRMNIVIDTYFIDMIYLFNMLVNFLTLNTQVTSSGPVKNIVEENSPITQALKCDG